MGITTKLPIGIENFEEIRTEGFYYVDKTGFIKELLDNWGKINLFTRPRRFGKSLNMSMLRYFFEYGCNTELFDHLEISKEKELCDKYMGKFPVISITLKNVDAMKYNTARDLLCSVIGCEALRFQFLCKSHRLSDDEKEQYKQLIKIDASNQHGFFMSDAVLRGSLLTLTKLLYRHYGQKVILLIDEYDVPLDKAQRFGYYDEMVDTIRSLFNQTLKTNDSLYFAVLTGCLRIAKESIFTGLNKFKVLSITNILYHEHFGFSDKEVRDMLKFYKLEEKYEQIKAWYDGYRFGSTDVYCPWDVINCVDLMRAEPDALPRPFWINTSSNDIIRKFLCNAEPKIQWEIERLINGETVTKKINQELTYRDLYQSPDNLWSILFSTGYLTQRGQSHGETFSLAIPNLEIRKIFIDQLMDLFQEEAKKDTPKLDAFCDAFAHGDAQTVEQLFNEYLKRTISIRDTSVRKEKKENFYHGILLGLLSHREDWGIDSNAESGEGFCDILVEILGKNIGLVIEVKYPDNGNLEKGCIDALDQIERKGYETRLRQDDITTVIKYGIACYKKTCKVMLG